MGSDYSVYDANNPWPCPGPGLQPDSVGVDSVPDGLTLSPLCGGRLVAGWSISASEASFAFGFKVSRGTHPPDRPPASSVR